MRSSTQFRVGLSVLALLHLAVLVPGFFAPYDAAEQNRSLSFAPPTAIHFKAHDGSWRLRPALSTHAEDRRTIIPRRPSTLPVRTPSTASLIFTFSELVKWLMANEFGIPFARHYFIMAGIKTIFCLL